jgi:ssRNA-specific RNase YbeY (16S rRNA maturation enzyme)
MASKRPFVAESRNYLVTTVAQAKEIASSWLAEVELNNVISFGLPEVDDRYHIWRVPLLSADTSKRIGEVVINAYTTEILFDKTTKAEMQLCPRQSLKLLASCFQKKAACF